MNVEYAEYRLVGKGLDSFARVTPDGRISISLDLKNKLPDLPLGYANPVKEFAVDENYDKPPRINIVIMIVGSRGDVQPFLALGQRLKKYGHRIRVATHEMFRSFVKEAGLEFFNIGGDPKDLMSYMVKNPGLIPGMDSLLNGDIGRKRQMMLDGCWKACYELDEESKRTFAADAIISNPPSFAHVHCAEALGIPLLLSFSTIPINPTNERCATTAFPHPLVNVKQSNAERGLTNYLSYPLADILTWQGLGDVINRFRSKTLGLEPLSLLSGPGITDRLRVPWTYCVSPSLVPKPQDWMNHIDIVGFYFLELATNYKPESDLEAFLAAGPPPVYIGFGSVTVEDPAAMTKTIFDAVKNAGVRALVSAGWGGLGGSSIPEDVFILGNVPHDWLFTKVSAVCHHGGAGTTAIGLRMGKPTIIVPFFGDQPFWGMMVHKAGAGPEPIPSTRVNVENLTKAIQFAVSPSAQAAAEGLGVQIRKENGIADGVQSFYRHLPLLNMRCDLDTSRIAVWFSVTLCLKLSAFAAQTLINAKLIDLNSLEPHRNYTDPTSGSKEYASTRNVTDPVTGGGSAIFWTITNYYAGIAKIFYSPVKGIIKTTTAIPIGKSVTPLNICIMNIITSVHEGFHNAPRLYGSQVREQEQVTDFSSGVKAGGKALFHGYWDGITGLVTEPLEGAKKEGFKGALKGAGRSWINATIRPAAGVVGVVAYPLHGVWKSGQKTWARKQGSQQRSTRIADGIEEVGRGSREERHRILTLFKDMATPEKIKQRRKEYTDAAKKALEESTFQPSDIGSTASGSTVTNSPPPRTPSMSRGSFEHLDEVAMPHDDDDDETFQRELELAMQLSLAEQRGYERAMAERLKDI
ncbi:glycosyltransferase family 1 protein [Ramaria rubella]|nr:glycosyltransferase family 1 protein [Ramaria rubella]